MNDITLNHFEWFPEELDIRRLPVRPLIQAIDHGLAIDMDLYEQQQSVKVAIL